MIAQPSRLPLGPAPPRQWQAQCAQCQYRSVTDERRRLQSFFVKQFPRPFREVAAVYSADGVVGRFDGHSDELTAGELFLQYCYRCVVSGEDLGVCCRYRHSDDGRRGGDCSGRVVSHSGSCWITLGVGHLFIVTLLFRLTSCWQRFRYRLALSRHPGFRLHG